MKDRHLKSKSEAISNQEITSLCNDSHHLLFYDLLEGFAKDQAVYMIAAQEGMRESQVDRAGLVETIDLFFCQFKLETSQVILHLPFPTRADYGDHVIRLLPDPTGGDL